MNTLPLSVLAATVLATLAMPAAAPAQAAGNGIQRCAAPDGTAIYTDRACASLGATAMPISGDLMTRLASNGTDDPAGSTLAVSRRSAAVARRSAASGCARSPTQLSMDLQGSWALGDVNRIAESYHWVGLDTTQARTIMQRLDRLSDQQLWQADFFDARIGGAMAQFADASGSAASDGGVMQLVFGDGASQRVQDFEVTTYRGCYFIRF